MLQNALPRSRFVVCALALTLCVCVTGCGGGGSSAVPAGAVSGKVTFEDKEVTEGLVSFMNLDAGEGDEAPLKGDGTYSIRKPLPTGDYKVTIMPLVVQQQVDGKGPEVGVEKPAPNIPEKYRNLGTTDLRATVKEGKNEFNFNMKR
ncbi:MAG: hypothetical protein L0Y72_21880 [Gemmataceae bacterium]|nr:hypothetical protein [Gemmataceae bacterium]